MPPEVLPPFVDAWAIGNHVLGEGRPTVASIDGRPHEERFGPGPSKRTFLANLADLPDGVFVGLNAGGEHAYLIREGHLLAWSPGGYTASLPMPVGEQVAVLTPASTVAAIRAGYAPEVHPSTFTLGRARLD